jgi:peptide/nickel transport system permease protein
VSTLKRQRQKGRTLATSATQAPRSRRRSASLIAGLICVGLIVTIALVSLVYQPYDPSDLSGGRLTPPSLAHWAGTDQLGRDMLTRLMIGAQIALVAGGGSVLIGAVVGIPLGMLAAFATRWLDDTLAAVLDILIAFPTLLLAMLIIAAQGASLGSAVFAIGLAMSSIVARLVRILVKRVLGQDYITAARTSGSGWPSIVGRHILPNIWQTVVVSLAIQFGAAVLAEASLSYLGLGAPPPNASWGALLQQAQATVYTAPLGAIAPGILLVVLVVGMNLIADGLRDIGDPTQRRRA